ncbi:toprim domain-containing protein [Chryseobacterium gallinarum]|uniref:toprim domain-containing protein n=1 Tax=Chryseobacterium gallinarum TaxID=1324352 RepID=UPI00373FDE08
MPISTRKVSIPFKLSFDNDQAGRQALHSLQSAGINVEDMSRHYSRYKDLNEYHVAQSLSTAEKANWQSKDY